MIKRFIAAALAVILAGAAFAEQDGIYNRIPVNSGSTPSAQGLTISATNLAAAYSIVKVNNWAGNCAQVQRASDSATLDIGFVNNICDKATADQFAAGSALSIAKWYDQSGNGADLVQATAANQPAYVALNEWIGGRRPITFDGLQASTSKFMTSSPASLNVLNHTIYMAVAPRTGFGVNSYYDMTDGGFTTTFAKISGSAQFPAMIYQGQFVIPTNPPLGGLGFISASSSSTGPTQILRVNNIEIARNRALTTQAIGLLNIGRLTTGTGNNGINDFFAILVYTAAHNSATMQTVEAAMNASFVPQTSFGSVLIYGGTSLMLGQGATLNQQPPWQSGFGRGPMADVGDWKTYLMSVGGQTLATEFTNRQNYINLIDATKKNVCLIGDITNDLAGPTYGDQPTAQAAADAFYNGTTLALVSALKTAGCTVVVPTMIARGPYTTVNFKEDARLRYNADVIAGAAANGYRVSDRGGNANFDANADTSVTTCYQADATHLTNYCYGIVARIDKAAITQ